VEKNICKGEKVIIKKKEIVRSKVTIFLKKGRQVDRPLFSFHMSKYAPDCQSVLDGN